jgi:hypothetical protein
VLTRNQVSHPWPGRGGGTTPRKPELSRVAKRLEELWVEVKCQANLEIAGSPRNAFRCSLVVSHPSGSALLGRGPVEGTDSRQTTNGRVNTRE